MRTGIILFVDDVKPRYRPSWRLDRGIGSYGTPLEIMAGRLGNIPGIDEIVLLVPSDGDMDPLAEQAVALRIGVERYESSGLKTKPWSASQERWHLESDIGTDTWAGTPIAATAAKHRWERLVLVPLENLLADRRGIVESLRLHAREGFDATFSEDRISGAGWTVLEAALVAGLQTSHPDIMATRGGLAWAVREPLYPFRIGEYHAPRHRPRLPVDLRLTCERVSRTLAARGDNAFATPGFEYLDWISTSGWEEAYLDSGPLTAWVEPSSVCAASCLHCPQPHLRRPHELMLPETFEKILNKIKRIEGLRWVFSGMGEPLANPGLGAMVELVKEWHLTLHTSLNEGLPDAFPWEHVDLVRISVDALDAAQFDAVRPGCSWESVERFLAAAAARKAEAPDRWPEIGVSLLKHRENEAAAGPFLKYWKQVCTPVFRSSFFTWPADAPPQKVQWFQILGAAEYLGAVEYAGTVRYAPLNRRPCPHALLGIHILQDGTIARCPYDIEGAHGWGNLGTKESFEEAWNGDAWRRFRREHLDLNVSEVSPCHRCQDWYHRE